ncbi:hypothetical protein ZOSMA_15G00410 [Zostera marina]|uniref:Uncharacterized protein n=1 Tax=Zostera marina TaxID=29655 RepID=A0A0K9PUJ2_ZOSMR|nr:hypothetical protein ZOSMA_15G00410 [Zostera marina]
MEDNVSVAKGYCTNKRKRDDDVGTDEVEVEAKRLRERLILDILESDDDDFYDTNWNGNQIHGEVSLANDLEDFMKRFVEDVGMVPTSTEEVSIGSSSDELGFLFEASDDELGLPPTVTLVPEEEKCVLVDGFDDGFDGFF